MAYKKITDADLQGVGVIGLADTPQLSAADMQEKFEETARSVIVPHFNSLVDQLNADKETVYTKTQVDSAITGSAQAVTATTDAKLAEKADKSAVYTKAEVDTAIGLKVEQLGAGDMAMIMYDANFNGIVDNAERLGGNLPEYYATKEEVNSALAKADSAMPNAGGTFTGAVTLNGAPTADLHPATKAYVDSHTANKSNPHGVTASQVGLGNVTNNKQMPIAGGTFTGNAIAYETARTTRGIFNTETRASSTTGTLQSVKYFIDVT